ncbi:MAG: cytochrome c biogenesis protein ResB, partial [Cyanobacteria bacterium J06600_6]
RSLAPLSVLTSSMLLVRTDSGASDRLRVQGDLLEVVDSAGETKQGSIFVKQDGSVSPKYLAGLELEAYTENAVEEINIAAGGTVNNPGARLSLKSDRMGQTIERTLAAFPVDYSQIWLGPAKLELIKTGSDEELNSLLNTRRGQKHPWGELEILASGKQRTIDVQANRGKTLRLGGIKLTVSDFYPDFRLDRDKQAATASENYNNPAIALEVSSRQGKERWYVFSRDFPPVRTVLSGAAIENVTLKYQVQPPEVSDYFRVIVGQDDQLYYAAKSSSKFKSGTLSSGQTVNPGWADFEITLEAYLPKAQIQKKVIVAEAQQEGSQIQGTPALLVKTESGQETWLPWGGASAIRNGDEEIYAAFSPKMYQIPFGIKLEDFIVDRNEGSESVAMWTSKIRIEDAPNNNVEQRKVWMNNPTWYKGWKIAQASWNPGDLQQSTLQVKREPAWVTALTWTGSALVILGIAVMFYAPSLSRKFRKQDKPAAIAETVENVETKADSELTTVA